MTVGEATLLTVSAFGVYAYHSIGAVMIIDHSAMVPGWLRRALLPRPSSTGTVRAMSLVWVVFMAVVSQGLVVAALLTRANTDGVHATLWLEVLAAAVWTLWLFRLTRHRGR